MNGLCNCPVENDRRPALVVFEKWFFAEWNNKQGTLPSEGSNQVEHQRMDVSEFRLIGFRSGASRDVDSAAKKFHCCSPFGTMAGDGDTLETAVTRSSRVTARAGYAWARASGRSLVRISENV